MTNSCRQTLNAGISLLIILSGMVTGIGPTVAASTSDQLARDPVSATATISSCTVIDSPGVYEIGADIVNSTAPHECIRIDANNVTVNGNGHIIDGVNETSGTVGVLIHSEVNDRLHNVTIRNLSIANWAHGVTVEIASNVVLDRVTTKSNGEDGIRITGVNNLDIIDGKIHSNEFNGIATGSNLPTKITIVNNRITRNRDGIDITADHITVRNNRVINNSDEGIRLGEANISISHNNVSENGGWGISVWADTNSTITNNAMYNNTNGIRVNSNITVRENEIRSSNEKAIQLNGNDLLIENNTISETTGASKTINFGFAVQDNTIRNNTIVKNKRGVRVGGNNHTVVNNHFETTTDDSGLTLDGTNFTVTENLIQNNSQHGIHAKDKSGERDRHQIRDNVVFDNGMDGIFLDGADHIHLINNTALDNDRYGFGLIDTRNNSLTNNTAANTSNWDFYTNSFYETPNNTVTNLTLGTGSSSVILSFSANDVSLRANQSPPATPTGLDDVGVHFEAESNSEASFLDITVRYAEAGTTGINESTLSLWRWNGSAWSEVSGNNTVNPATNTVSANITNFSVFAPLGKTSTATSTITGQIILPNGDPAINNTVTAGNWPLDAPDGGFKFVETNATGHFSVTVNSSHTYAIQYNQADFIKPLDMGIHPRDRIPDLFAVTSVNTTDGPDTIQLGSFKLPTAYAVNISVVNQSGVPVEGAPVEINHKSNDSGHTVFVVPTEENGMFHPSTSPPPGIELVGNVTISVEPPDDSAGFVNKTYRRNLTVDRNLSISFTLNEVTPEIVLQQDHGFTTTDGLNTSKQVAFTADNDLTFENGTNYRLRLTNTDDGSSVTLAFNGSVTVPANDPIALLTHEGDGTAEPTPLLWPSRQSGPIPAKVVNGSVPAGTGIFNFSVTLVNASDGTDIASTGSAPAVLGYSGTLAQNSTTGVIRLGLPRDVVPKFASATFVLRQRNANGDMVFRKELPMSYDSGADAFVTDIRARNLSTGNYSWKVIFESNGTRMLQVGSFSNAKENVTVIRNTTVSFTDQFTDGSSVTIDSVKLSAGGFVVIHNGSASAAVIGNSSYLTAGQHDDIRISLEEPLPDGTSALSAVAHTDSNANRSFDFPSADPPYFLDGVPVSDSATVTVGGPTVTLNPRSAEVGVNSRTQVAIRLTSAPDGLAGYWINVTVANASVASVTNASVPPTYRLNKSVVHAGNRTATLAATDVHDDIGPGASNISLGTVTVGGDTVGDTALKIDIVKMDDDAGSPLVASASNGSITVESIPVVCAGCGVPTDPDNDGNFEDLNGNGHLDFNDVVVLFVHLTEPAVMDHVTLYDFNENGRIDFDDIVTLFEEI